MGIAAAALGFVEWFGLVAFRMCVVNALVNPSPSCCIV
jgi:hypothetical protein